MKSEEEKKRRRRKFREKRRNFLFSMYANFKTFFVLCARQMIFSFSIRVLNIMRVVSVIHTEKNRIKISGIK